MLLIIGCTASGKGTLAFNLAKKLNTSIISVDSMKVYRRMNIGTAKPSRQAREKIKHHLIDIVEPSEPFSLGRYMELADQTIEKLKRSQQGPIIAAGGTAMYIRALLEGIFSGPPSNHELRNSLKKQALEHGNAFVYAQLQQIDPKAAQRIHPNDQKRIIRAIEVYKLTGKPISELQKQFFTENYRYNWHIIGIRRSKADNNHRINARVKKMYNLGLVDEVKSLLNEPSGLSPQAAQAVGYAEIIDYLNGKYDSLDDAFEKIKINTRRLAKSQRTWFKRFKNVTWFDVNPDETSETITERVLKHIETVFDTA